MHLGHEFVEMGAALVQHRAVLEKQIHQHGLAAPDFAMDVEAAGGASALSANSRPNRLCLRSGL